MKDLKDFLKLILPLASAILFILLAAANTVASQDSEKLFALYMAGAIISVLIFAIFGPSIERGKIKK